MANYDHTFGTSTRTSPMTSFVTCRAKMLVFILISFIKVLCTAVTQSSTVSRVTATFTVTFPRAITLIIQENQSVTLKMNLKTLLKHK